MSTATLSSDAKYDDQGLFVSLIVGAALLVTVGGFIAYLYYTPILWLKRFYRPNHTIEPTPLAAFPTGGVPPPHRWPHSPSPSSPTSPSGQTAFAEHHVRPHGRRGPSYVRRKRLGVSLPFKSTFFVWPRWRDWISIEEPSLMDRKESALSTVHHRDGQAPLRHTCGRSFVPLQTSGAASPIRPMSPRNNFTELDSEHRPLSPKDVEAAILANTHDSVNRISGEAGNGGLYSPRSGGPAGAGTPSYGAVTLSQPLRPPPIEAPSSLPPGIRSPHSIPGLASGEPLPKTPIDPLVAVYLFTLKFFFALMFFGEIFTVWIMVIASRDDYMRRMMLQRDIHSCGLHDDDEEGCTALKPYCKFRGIALGCAVVPLHGIYDLTVSNIKPRSWRWTPVGILNLGFCVVVVVFTLVYLRKVGQYVEAVMANQMRHALGYRVVCIRGLDTTDIGSGDALRRNFLELPVYFPEASPPGSSSPAVASPNGLTRPRRARNMYVTNDSIFSEYHYGDDSYTICECPGMNCLFSTAGVHYYVVRREDAAFTEPGNVEQILITREPPFGMLDTISNTESAMAELQDAIADEKALRRKMALQRDTPGAAGTLRRRHTSQARSNGIGAGGLPTHRAVSVLVTSASDDAGRSGTRKDGGSGTGSHCNDNDDDSDNGSSQRGDIADDEDAVLMMRCTFPACCDKMPAVPYYESVFLKYAAELNREIEQVPHQHVAGAAFVIFKDSLYAYEFMQLFTARFGGLLSPLSATIAGPPGRIFQNSLTAGRCALFLRFILVFIVYVALIFTWSIPVSFLGSLESLSEIPGFGDYLIRFTRLSSTLQSLLNAYLPVLVLAIFNVALPHIIRVFVRAMGAFNRTECDGGQLYLQYVFMVITAVIAQAAFQGAMNRLADLIADPNEEAIINFLVACVTPSNGYFYAKIVSAICLSVWIDLLDPARILKVVLLRGRAHIQRNYDELFLPCEFEFPRLLSFDMMILSMGLLFHMTAPLLGLLSIVYFFLRYWSQRAKQYDRYRPTLSPAHDCTDFSVPAQVIRSVMLLFCFAEVCGVVLMGLRDHSGGVIMCSLSLGTGIALTIYVYIYTRKWTPSLATVRHSFTGPHPFHHSHPYRYHQQLGKQQQAQSPQQGTNGKSAGGTPRSQDMRASQYSSPSGAPLAKPSQSHVSPLAPASVLSPLTPRGGLPVYPPRHGGSSPNGGAAGASPSVSEDPFEMDPADNPTQRQLSGAARTNIVQEENMLDNYERATLNHMIFRTHRNPFISHLLPRRAGATLRYQPKHQRLAVIDAVAEVRVMQETNFVVERYWERGMSWFEEDTAEWCADLDVSDRRSSGNDSHGGASSLADANAPSPSQQQPLPRRRPREGSPETSEIGHNRERTSSFLSSTTSPTRVATTLAPRAQAAVGQPVVAVPSSIGEPQQPHSLNSAEGNASHSPLAALTPPIWCASVTPSETPPLPLRGAEEGRNDDDEEQEVLQRSIHLTVATSPLTPTSPGFLANTHADPMLPPPTP